MNKLKYFLSSVSVFATSLLLTGCGEYNPNLYEEVVQDVNSVSSNSPTGLSISKTVEYYCISYFTAMKRVAPAIMIGSFLFGMAIFLLIRKAKPIRKFALFVFVIGIPLITFIAVYGLAILLGAFTG